MAVVSLVGKLPADAQNAQAVEVLTDLLDRAKAGKVVAVAAVTYGPDRSMVTDISGGADADLLLGGAQCLAYRLLKQIYQD
jgi:hypothetical protein